MFKPVNSRVSFPQLEEGILAFWKSGDIFKKSVEARRHGPRFVLYEGPPTANGSPGIHHVLARTFKDIIPRYKTMKGCYAPRIAGWDTHGLPVELEVEKQLGFSGKAQIEEYGIEKFNALCRQSVFRYLKQWDEMTERIAYWVDLDKAYITMNNDYIESVWWAIKQMWDKDLIYQGYRVTPHCPRCGTSLSSHEVALGYQDDTEDPSVYIKFKVVDDISKKLPMDKPVYLLAWTTTPWTLPGNTALAVSPEAEYVLLEGECDYLIMASRRVGGGLEGYQATGKYEGKRLVGITYEPLYNPHRFDVERRRFQKGAALPVQEADDKLAYRVISGDFVTMEDGTGIVHIAPSYGEVDYQAGEENGLDFVHHVDLQGVIMGSYAFAGKFVKDADKEIMADLKARGLLYKSGKIKHTYPFCWRCDTPLLYYAKQTWYIRTTAVKDKLISGNEAINWYPEHIKYGRFGDWLQNNVDWAFSRERYWGTPLPLWKCESCGAFDCIGGVDDLKNKKGFSGFREPLDLHRPFVDELTFDCPKCGKEMKRVPEVIDCWFDSGAMPLAQSHYPFENATLLEDGRFPADFICEAVDQTRGWFYSLHAIATLLFGRPSYRNVICLGHILDAEGEKMSKSRGNVVEPAAVINQHGADALRWYLYTSSPPGNVRRFSEELVAEVSRRFLSTLWNVYSFFVLYANIDHFVPAAAFSPPDAELDRWVLSELHQLIADVDGALEHYNPTDAGRKIEEFVDGLSNWYVRRSRRRFWKSENDTDKLSAYNTLYQCLVTLAKLLAPFAPFVAEEFYQNLVRSVFTDAPESVHLADFPVADESCIDKQLITEVRMVMSLVSKARALRSEKGIKVRQPINEIPMVIKADWIKRAINKFEAEIKDEVNAKKIVFYDSLDVLDSQRYPSTSLGIDSSAGSSAIAVDTYINEELKKEGVAREIVRRLQTMRRSANFEIADSIVTYYEGDDYIRGVVENKTLADYIRQETLSRELVAGVPADADFKETHKLSGHAVTLGVKRVK